MKSQRKLLLIGSVLAVANLFLTPINAVVLASTPTLIITGQFDEEGEFEAIVNLNENAYDRSPALGTGSYDLGNYRLNVNLNREIFNFTQRTEIDSVYFVNNSYFPNKKALTFAFNDYLPAPSNEEFIFWISFLNNGQDPDTPWNGDLTKIGKFLEGKFNTARGDLATVSSANITPVLEPPPVPEPIGILSSSVALGFGFLLQRIKQKPSSD